MNPKLSFAALVLVACALAALPALANGTSSNGIEIVVAGTGNSVTDTNALQRALDQCAATGRPLVLDATSKPFFIDSTVTLKPQSGTAVMGLRISAFNKPDGSPTIWYTGTGACFKAYGLKSSLISGVRIQLRGTAGVGFWFTSNADYQSTNANIIQQCSVSGNTAGQAAGFWIGPEDDNTGMGEGSNDINTFAFDHCQVSGDSGSKERWIDRGFWIWGGNCKDLQFSGCGVSYCKDAAFCIDVNSAYHKSAYVQGSQFIGCDSSHVSTAFRIKGGCEAVILGGRTEALDESYSVVGIAGGGAGMVKVIGFKDAGHTLPRVSPGDKSNPVSIG